MPQRWEAHSPSLSLAGPQDRFADRQARERIHATDVLLCRQHERRPPPEARQKVELEGKPTDLGYFAGRDQCGFEIPRRRERRKDATAGLLPVTLAPYFLGLVGPIYFAVAGSMGAWFLYRSVLLFRERTDEAARGVFRVSPVFLFSVFLAMLLDLMIPVGSRAGAVVREVVVLSVSRVSPFVPV